MKLKAVRRWAPWLALVVVFSLATTLLSWWQFDRREDRVAQIEMVNANYDIPPVPLSQLPWDFEFGQPVNEWRKVVIEGNYLPEQAVIVRNRPLRGQPGFLQLVPFRLNNGEILVVERGWLSAGEPVTVPQSNPMPNTLPRELIVRLRLSEQDLNRGDVPGQLASVHIASLQDELGLGLITEFYGRLVSEAPAMQENPRLMPKPSLNEGNHLSYALQWILFGVMAFWALFWAIGNERRLRLEAQGLKKPKKKKITQADRDADIEDAQ